MRVCLIVPDSPFLLDSKVFPNLGVLQVAAALEDFGHEVSVLDLSGETDQVEKVHGAVSDFDIFGITSTTPQFPKAVEALRAIRDIDPTKRVIIGGPHPTMMPESCGLFDCIVQGDGEEAIEMALNPSSPKVLDFASNTTKGELRWRWPARHLIDMDSYKYSLLGRKGTSMLWSMGCSFGCLYCSGRLSPFFRRVRSRNLMDVVKEIEYLQDVYGISAVMAFDDEVNLLNEPLLELCRAIKPLGIKWRAFVKANLFTDQQAQAMSEAGCVEACTGVEQGDDRILGIMEKKTTREINKRFVDLSRKHGMRAKAFCSLGHPGQDYESCMNTKEWLLWAKPDDFDLTVISVYPGTPIWAERQQIGKAEDGKTICKYVKRSKNRQEDGATLFFEEVNYADEFTWYKGVPGQYQSHVWTPDLSKEDLIRLRDEIEDDVRRELGIPYPQRFSGDHITAEGAFDHSMGAGLSPQNSHVIKGVKVQ